MAEPSLHHIEMKIGSRPGVRTEDRDRSKSAILTLASVNVDGPLKSALARYVQNSP